MSYSAQTARYLEADVMSRPKEWLVPLLYEHLLAGLHRASVQIERGDVEGKSNSLQQANSILLELTAALDTERGGELAAHLGSLYSYFVGEVIEVGRTMDSGRLKRVIAMLTDLHEGWVQAAEAVAPRGRSDLALAGRA